MKKSLANFGFTFNKTGILIIAFILSLIPRHSLLSQVTCGGTEVSQSCLLHPSESYQCIEGLPVNSSSLYNNQLLPPASAATTPQFIIVKTVVIFDEDYTFAPGSDIVFLDGGSKFIVSNNKKMTLNGADLHGCTKMWGGVEVRPAATIIAKNCTFEDAKAAITMRQSSKIEATGNTFRGNLCGILFTPTPPFSSASFFLASRRGVSGNLFYGDQQLLEPVNPGELAVGNNASIRSWPYNGIWLEGVNSIVIGFIGNGGPVNQFLNFGQNPDSRLASGIFSMQSNVGIQNCKFANIGFFNSSDPGNSVTAFGVYARNNSTYSTTTTRITGLGVPVPTQLPYPEATFSNCHIDARIIGTNLYASNVYSRQAQNSFWIAAENSSQNQLVEITNNKIDRYRSTAIRVDESFHLTLKIMNNEIVDNPAPADVAFFKFAIYLLNESANASLKGSIVSNNKIYWRSTVGGAFFGIAVANYSNLVIQANDVKDESGGFPFAGIFLQDANGSRVLVNNVTGQNTSVPLGIRVNRSGNCLVHCNETGNLWRGYFFSDAASDGTDFLKNRLYQHTQGLYLEDGTVMGEQTNRENRWIGTGSTTEALFDIPGYLPGTNDPAILDLLDGSKFTINSSDFNSDYWPLPRLIGASPDGGDWFEQGSGEPSGNFGCHILGPGVSGERLTSSDLKILNNTYVPYKGYVARTWEAQWHFYGRLHRNPDLRPVGSSAEIYYNNQYNTNVGRLYRAYDSFINRWWPGGTLESDWNNAADNLRSLINQRLAFEDQLATTEIESEIAQLHAQMAAMDASIESAVQQLVTATSVVKNNADQLVQTLLTEVNSIATTLPHEQNMKTTLLLLLQAYSNAETFTESQLQQISAMAHQCRMSGGYGVAVARGLMPLLEEYPEDQQCVGQRDDESADLKQADAKITVFPNPASDHITLLIYQPYEKGLVVLRDIWGRDLHTWNISGSGSTVTLNNLKEVASGVYMLDISLDNFQRIRQKIAIQR